MNKSLWKYMCECSWHAPIIGSFIFMLYACAAAHWIVGLIGVAVIWLLAFIIFYFDAKSAMRKDIERENREPKSCPRCGHKTKSEHCENCGKWLYAPETNNKCYNCGRECTTNFCGHCGWRQ